MEALLYEGLSNSSDLKSFNHNEQQLNIESSALAAVSSEKAHLLSQLKSRTVEIDRLNIEAESLKRQIKHLSTRNRELEAEIESVYQENTDALLQKLTERKILDEKVYDLECELSCKLNTISQIKDENSAWMNKFSELVVEFQAYKTQADQEKATLLEKVSLFSSLAALHDEEREAMKDLERENDELLTKLASFNQIETEIGQLKKENAKLSQFSQLNISSNSISHSELVHKIVELQNELEDAIADKENAEDALVFVKSQIESKADFFASQAALSSENEKLHQQTEELRKRLHLTESNLKELTKNQFQFESQYEILISRNKQQNHQIATLLHEIQFLSGTNSQLEGSGDTQKYSFKSIAGLVLENEELQSRLESLQAEREVEISCLKESLSRAKDTIEELKKQSLVASPKVTIAQSDDSIVKDLEVELNKIKKDFQKANSSLQSMANKKDALQERLTRTELDLKSSQHDLVGAKQEIEKLLRRCTVSQNEVSNITEALGSFKKENSKLKGEVSSLQFQLKSLLDNSQTLTIQRRQIF
jgi:DNA repair protein SbcC/Rad50